MLKREHLKLAIDAIARRSPEIGYSLDELFASGQIDALPVSRAASPLGDYLFKFQGQTATVRRFAFFNEGTAPIEQQLLIHYGQLAQKQSVDQQSSAFRYRQAAEQIHHAGFDFLVGYEIDQALTALEHLNGPNPQRDKQPDTPRLRAALHRLKAETSQFNATVPESVFTQHDAIHLKGYLGNKQPALFTRFPLCRQGLVQLAELNLEFFQVRTVLTAMLRGQTDQLFACLIRGFLAGVVLLGQKRHPMQRALEIRYIASARDRLPGLPLHPLRGVGSFLVAGVWFFWKLRRPECNELVLDSEIGAMGFYDAIGFAQHRRFYYKLSSPKGHLLDCMVRMAEFCPNLDLPVLAEIAVHLRRQIRFMATAQVQDKALLRAIRHSLLSRRHSLLATTAAEELVRQRSRIGQADELLRIGVEQGRLRFKESSPAPRMLILQDAAYAQHLPSVFHMESPRRLDAFRAALNHASLAERWIGIAPRAATLEELNWVHSRDYIATIAATAGKTIRSLDLDTQTTARSYEIACLAAGGVFALLDAVWAGESTRGFACVRPPGHHAEPERAMGFCLFNNVALAAHYLEKIYGLERILIVDIDAHHGNGTQKAFYNSSSVLFASLHQFPCYPGSGNLNEVGAGAGEGFTVNIPLPKGSGDAEFAQAIYAVVRPIAHQYEPEALLVSCGFDLYRQDKLASMNGSPEGYALMTYFLKEMADQLCGGRIVYVLEGGYHLTGIETCALRTLQELAGIPTLRPELIERVRTTPAKKFPTLRNVIAIQKRYWTLD